MQALFSMILYFFHVNKKKIVLQHLLECRCIFQLSLEVEGLDFNIFSRTHTFKPLNKAAAVLLIENIQICPQTEISFNKY